MVRLILRKIIEIFATRYLKLKSPNVILAGVCLRHCWGSLQHSDPLAGFKKAKGGEGWEGRAREGDGRIGKGEVRGREGRGRGILIVTTPLLTAGNF